MPTDDDVAIYLSYDDALRLSYMARFPDPASRGKGGTERDAAIAARVDEAIKQFEEDHHG